MSVTITKPEPQPVYVAWRVCGYGLFVKDGRIVPEDSFIDRGVSVSEAIEAIQVLAAAIAVAAVQQAETSGHEHEHLLPAIKKMRFDVLDNCERLNNILKKTEPSNESV